MLNDTPAAHAVRFDNNIRGAQDFGTLPADLQTAVDATFRSATGVIVHIDATSKEVRESRHYSEEGKAERLASIIEAAAPSLNALEADVLRDEQGQMRARSNMEEGWLKRTGEFGWTEQRPIDPAGDELRIAQEIRDGLRQLKPGEVDMIYLRALESGDDPQLVRAIESAPKSRPLVSALTQKIAREVRWNSYPQEMRDGVEHAERALELRKYKLFDTKRLLNELVTSSKGR